MTITTTIALTACCLFSAFASQALADANSIRSADREIWVSGGAANLDYKESIASPDLPDSEHSWTPSIGAGISYLDDNNFYYAFEGSVNFGDAHYKGSLLASPTVPITGTTQERIDSLDIQLGKGFMLGNYVMLTPYTELGTRSWHRNLSGTQQEDYSNLDALGGLMLQVSPARGLVFSVFGSGGTTIAPQMQTQDVTFYLGRAVMYKAGAKIGYDLTDKVELFTTADYEHFRYRESGVVDGLLEPTSSTDSTSTRVGLAYHF